MIRPPAPIATVSSSASGFRQVSQTMPFCRSSRTVISPSRWVGGNSNMRYSTLAAGLPLVIATPVLGLLLNLDATSTSAVALTLLAGTPALTFTGMIGAALAVTLHRGGLLLAVLVLPLSIPVLIFGVAASDAVITGPLSFGAPFSILCALSLISFVIGPFAAAASLRQGLD